MEIQNEGQFFKSANNGGTEDKKIELYRQELPIPDIKKTLGYTGAQAILFTLEYSLNHASQNTEEQTKLIQEISQIEQDVKKDEEQLDPIQRKYFSAKAIRKFAHQISDLEVKYPDREKYQIALNNYVERHAYPRLADVGKIRSVLTGKESSDEKAWHEIQIPRKEGGYSAIELNNEVRHTVTSYVNSKIDALLDMPSLSAVKNYVNEGGLEEDEQHDRKQKIIEALTNGWFEALPFEDEDKLMLMEAAHIVKRIELATYSNFLKPQQELDTTQQMLQEQQLAKLGLNSTSRDVLLEVVRTSALADPLFIRMASYMDHTQERTRQRGSEIIYTLPSDKKKYTFPELFPTASKAISKNFFTIAMHDDSVWNNIPGGEQLRQELLALSKYYNEKNPEKAETILRRQPEEKEDTRLTVIDAYKNALESESPIIIIPSMFAQEQEPQMDQELKICLSVQGDSQEEQAIVQMREAMSLSAATINMDTFADTVNTMNVKRGATVGSYGVNLVFNGVAYEDPSILLVLDEQIRAYDKDFPSILEKVGNTEEVFAESSTEERTILMEQLSRFNTILHEFSHGFYPEKRSPENQRFGKYYSQLNETKAEISYRALLPSIIEQQGLEQTKEQWAVTTLASSLQTLGFYDLQNADSRDDYYYASVYPLKKLFASGVVEIDKVNNKVRINGFDEYYSIMKEAAIDLLKLYKDESMTEGKTGEWLETNCVIEPSQDQNLLQAVEIFNS
jgi:hypothetical protein